MAGIRRRRPKRETSVSPASRTGTRQKSGKAAVAEADTEKLVEGGSSLAAGTGFRPTAMPAPPFEGLAAKKAGVVT